MQPFDTFKRNVEEVDRLINFDRELIQVVILTVEELHAQLKEKHADPRLNGARALRVIRGLRDNETIRLKYQAIYNQAIVLLVSHFGSALGDIFRQAVNDKLSSADPGRLADEEFKVTVVDLRDKEWSLKGAIPDLLIAKYDYTFQDMGASVRAFAAYTDLIPPRGELMNNVITAQACRHVIVHAGGRISEKTIRQVSKANPRKLKNELLVGDHIAFSLDEVDTVKKTMIEFISILIGEPSPQKTDA